MIPHERSLVKDLADKPFALIGVNSDADLEQIKRDAEKEGISWRSFFDGGGTGGPIATRWNVSGWPTIYLIDHEGVIRSKGHALDEELLRRLVAEAEQ
ncbi:MAG TPA: TlpA family protein disulfide reductase [Planctomycetes bacterium]|nr:TlpA family protein disulfide reductase [Planctomycetota bacterium]